MQCKDFWIKLLTSQQESFQLQKRNKLLLWRHVPIVNLLAISSSFDSIIPVLKPSCIFHLCSTSPVVQPYFMQPWDDFKSSIITWFLTQEFRLRCFLLISHKLVVVYLRHLFSFGTKSLWPTQCLSHLGVVGLTPASSRSFSKFFLLMLTEVRIYSYNQVANWHRNLLQFWRQPTTRNVLKHILHSAKIIKFWLITLISGYYTQKCAIRASIDSILAPPPAVAWAVRWATNGARSATRKHTSETYWVKIFAKPCTPFNSNVNAAYNCKDQTNSWQAWAHRLYPNADVIRSVSQAFRT